MVRCPVAFLAFLAVAGCVQSNAVQCDGFLCPNGSTCDNDAHQCISPAQLDACSGKADGDTCNVNGVVGACSAAQCVLSFCGDSVINGAEQCDGAELGGLTCADLHFHSEGTGLTCTDTCKLDTSGCVGACGDGIKNGGELCDGADLGGATCKAAGFYNDAGLTCSAFCVYDVSQCTGFCGDHMINGGEVCDGTPPPSASCVSAGLDAGSIGCSSGCGFALDRCGRFGFVPDFAGPVASNGLAVGGSDTSDLWLVGTGGLAMHYQGAG